MWRGWLAFALLATSVLTVAHAEPAPLELARTLYEEARTLQKQGHYREAEASYRRALALREQHLGPAHLDVAATLNDLAGLLNKGRGDYAAAEPLYRRALAIRESALGSAHPDVASTLNNLAGLLRARADYAAAEALYRDALARQRALGREHLDLAVTLNNLAGLLKARGDYEGALSAYRESLAIKERLGSDQADIATSLANLAGLLGTLGDYAAAQPLYERALAIKEKTLGAEHPSIAKLLHNLAWLLENRGDYAAAEPLYRRALAIREQKLGPTHPSVATSLNNLAWLLEIRGEYVASEALHRRALAIKEQALGPEHPGVATTLHNLAELLESRGDYAAAEPLYRRALAIKEKALGPDHARVANSLDSLAELLEARGDHAAAEPLSQRGLAIRERALGKEHPDVAISLNTLARLLEARGEAAAAEALYERALAILEQKLGGDHPELANTASHLARVRSARGDQAGAEALVRRALAIREAKLGKEHPDVALSLNDLAQLATVRGDVAAATQQHRLALAVEERVLARDFGAFTEREKAAFAAKIRGTVDRNLSLHLRVAPTDAAARLLALATVLQRKGRILDASADVLAVLRARSGEGDARLDELRVLRSELATRTLRGPLPTQTAGDHQAVLSELSRRVEELERELGRRYVELRSARDSVTPASVARRLARGQALVEIVEFRELAFTRQQPAGQWGDSHYAVYVLHAGGNVRFVDLGKAAPIDDAVARLRTSLASPRGEVKAAAREVDALVMAKVRSLLGAVRRIYLSPDGALNLIPFGALVDPHGRYLIETMHIDYLASGRELLRQDDGVAARAPVLAFVAPDYDAVLPGAAAHDHVSLAFAALPGTQLEGELLKQALGDVQVVSGTAASETALGAVHGPRMLHVATHGFFLGPSQAQVAEDERSTILAPVPMTSVAETPHPALPENPLLRSGIALAGANVASGTGSDGLMTAMELTHVDLRGTELVTLSACETGLGQVTSGEGVYGLRRALAIAGAEASLLSLWKVADRETAQLMGSFYGRLSHGRPRGAALREVQRERVARGVHPYYWAAFILSGDPRPLGR